MNRVLPLLLVALLGCSSESGDPAAEPATGEADLSVPAYWDAPVTRVGESITKPMRAACKFGRGTMPSQTLGKEMPVDREIPIETVVVFQQENRSFDSYFGRLAAYLGRNDIESPPIGASNPTKDGTRYPWQHGAMPCMPDTNHEWGAVHAQIDGGRMDGFWQTNDGWTESFNDLPEGALSGNRAMWFYDQRDIPYYYELARNFAIADHYFASVPGPTYPNRQYLYSATSFGNTANHSPDSELLRDNTVIFDELEKRGISWKIYTAGFPAIPRVGALLGTGYLTRWGFMGGGHFASMGNFADDAKAGALPQVAFVDASINEDVWGTDEHPPADIQVGQRWVAQQLDLLMHSPQWPTLAAFLTYDEHGGLYDHVAPPAACPPDEHEPVLESKDDRRFPGRFDTYGPRVPFVAISPWVKKGHVSHVTYDHTSVLRFIEAKFKVPAMSARDANADALMDMFDFSRRSIPTPPAIPIPTVNGRQLSACAELLGPKQPNNDH